MRQEGQWYSGIEVVGLDNPFPLLIANNVISNGLKPTYPSDGTDYSKEVYKNAGIALMWNEGKTRIVNNIFYNNKGHDFKRVRAKNLIKDDSDGLQMSNNLYYKVGGDYTDDWFTCKVDESWQVGSHCDSKSYGRSYNTLPDWQKLNYDLDSIWKEDPLFKVLAPEAAEDYQIQSTSPAVGKGADVGLKTDFFGNPVPAGAKPSIGVDEVK
jgi:hypothetical protein